MGFWLGVIITISLIAAVMILVAMGVAVVGAIFYVLIFFLASMIYTLGLMHSGDLF